MARIAMVSAVVLCLLPVPAWAGQTVAGFSVGITIGGGGGHRAQTAAKPGSKTYTWGAAAISVRQAGYGKARRVEKSGALYWFTGTRGGATYRIAVSISSGNVVKVIPA